MRVLLYYCYTPIADPAVFAEEHHRLCVALQLRGRIIIAAEGLNGTVSGTFEACDAYIAAVHADPRFAACEFKAEDVPDHTFRKLHVRVKNEIVHAGLPALKPWERTAPYVEPAEFQALKDADDVVLLDVRSTYEHGVGHFKNAFTLPIENFRELPAHADDLAALREQTHGKRIVTYCTGGVKCEKASAWLLDQGFENVYQLHGGIIKYGLETGGEDFEGKCYVFDSRLAIEVNHVNPSVVGRCHVCAEPSDRLINCANSECNAHLVVCESCSEKLEGACSVSCLTAPTKRPYDGTGFYPKNTQHYDPAQALARYK
jgi:UPF0176 protein